MVQTVKVGLAQWAEPGFTAHAVNWVRAQLLKYGRPIKVVHGRGVIRAETDRSLIDPVELKFYRVVVEVRLDPTL